MVFPIVAVLVLPLAWVPSRRGRDTSLIVICHQRVIEMHWLLLFSYAKQCPSNEEFTKAPLNSSEKVHHCIPGGLWAPAMRKALDVIQLLNTQPFVHQYELWWYIFYIIADIESMDILIKGSEYWVGAPTAHQLSLPGGLDSHNPFEE